MNGFVLAAKAAALLSDQNVRKRFGWTLVIILSPIIVVLAFILSLASGSASHNTAAVELCFNGGVVPAQMPAEYRSYIEEMRDSFLTLDQYLESINGMTEGGKSVDTVQVKADFYALFLEMNSLAAEPFQILRIALSPMKNEPGPLRMMMERHLKRVIPLRSRLKILK